MFWIWHFEINFEYSPATYYSGLEDRPLPALLSANCLRSSSYLFLSPKYNTSTIVQFVSWYSPSNMPWRARKRLNHYCTFSLKEITCISALRLRQLIVHAMWPTVWQNSISLENFHRSQRRASHSAAITVNTNHNICTYMSHGWITLSTSALFRWWTTCSWGIQTHRKKPWKPSEVGWINLFLKNHWLQWSREWTQCTRATQGALGTSARPSPGLGPWSGITWDSKRFSP